VSLTTLTERVHSDGAIPPGQKYFLLMALEVSHAPKFYNSNSPIS
jgi:hypothetical protein